MVGVRDVRKFERELLDHLRRSEAVLPTIKETQKLEDDTIETLKSEVAKFKKSFQTEEGKNLVEAGHEESEALEDESVEQEQIVRQKRG